MHHYREFYMHGTGHWLGIDVHDVGDYRIARASRVLEPGLYVAPGAKGVPAKWQGLGIRIEDDVAITKQGHEVLTGDVPRGVDDIEAVLATR